MTINTHSYDVLIRIHHGPQSLKDWGGPTGAIAVESDKQSDVMNKMEGYYLKNEKLQLLFVMMPAHYLVMEICDSMQINLRCTYAIIIL